MMKALFIAALVAAVSAELVEIDTAIVVPSDWKRINLEVNKNQKVDVTVGLKRQNMEQIEAEIYERSNPKSAQYSNWYTSEEMRAIVAPPQAHIDQVVAWLKSHGAENFKFTGIASDVITVTTTYGAAEKMFNLPVQMYVKGNKVLPKAVGNVRVPAEIAAIIDSVTGIHAFPIEKSILRSESPEAIAVVPAVIIKRYNITTTEKVPTSNSKAVAEFQGQFIKQTDVCTFYQQFKLNGSCTINKFIGKNQNEAGIESTLDCEYIDAVSDDVPLNYYIFPGMDFCTDVTNWASSILSTPQPGYVHSVSYGAQDYNPICPKSTQDRTNQDFMLLSGKGISVVIASGDSGSGYYSRSGFNQGYLVPSWPADSTWSTAVGATYFYENNLNVEMAVTGFGSGGGFSWNNKKQPAFQAAAVDKYFQTLPASSLPPKKSYPDYKASRATPDVSALGWEYTLILNGQPFPGIGGTSASTPVFAGILARLNDLRLAAGKKTLGSVNQLVYQNEDAFYDVTIGSDKIGQNTEGWDCAKGWDPVTGLGTPNYAKLEKIAMSLQ